MSNTAINDSIQSVANTTQTYSAYYSNTNTDKVNTKDVSSDDSSSTVVTLSDAATSIKEKEIAKSYAEEQKIEREVEEKKISKALEERNKEQQEAIADALNKQNIGLNFSIDKDTDSTVVKVTDLNTKEMVRQIPTEDFLKLSKLISQMQEQNQVKTDKESIAKGLIFDENA